MRITFVNSSLQAGGAERVITQIANFWAKNAKDISIVTFDKSHRLPFYDLHPAIRHFPLGLASHSNNSLFAIKKNIKRLFKFRKTIKSIKPDVIISFIDVTNVFVIVATMGLGIKVIISERSDPTKSKLSPLWSFLRVAFYPFCHHLVVQSDAPRTFISLSQ